MGGRSFAIVCAIGALAVAGCADHGSYTVIWAFPDFDAAHVAAGCGMHGVDSIHVTGRSDSGDGETATALCTSGQLSHSVSVGNWTLFVHQVDVRGREVDPADANGAPAPAMATVAVGKDADFPADPSPVVLMPRPACNDGIDNDGDGRVDLDDPDCADANGTSESPPP